MKKALSQPMGEMEIPESLSKALLLAFNEIKKRSTVPILEAYVTPEPLDSARTLAGNSGWTLIVFTEAELTYSERLDLIGDAWAASDDLLRNVDFFTLESSPDEQGCAVRQGIQIYP